MRGAVRSGIRRAPALVAVIVAALLTGAGPARAAFPGRDGLLAIQPVRGRGIELVRPDGTDARRICVVAALCGQPRDPRFSPNGRGIVFTDPSGRVQIVAPDGICLWCRAARVTPIQASAAGFWGNRTVISVRRGHGTVVRSFLTGAPDHLAASGQIRQAVASARGALAVVRRGWIWAQAGKRGLVRLTPGIDPAWSPRGDALTFDRGGWVWRIAAHPAAAARRLVRGTRPAWSPDGRRIAFVTPGHRIATLAAGGGGARPVPGVYGRTVDWQPLPATGSPCTPSPGTLIAQTREATISFTAGGSTTGAAGCVGLLGGYQRVFGPFTPCQQGGQTITAGAVSGRFAVLGMTGCTHQSTCQDGALVIDLATTRSGGGIAAPTGPSTARCTPGVDAAAVDSAGYAAWRITVNLSALGSAAGPLQCFAGPVCFSQDQLGDAAFASTDPGGGAGAWRGWLQFGAHAIACTPATVCLTPGPAGVRVTSDPLSAPTGWPATVLAGQAAPVGLDCARSGSTCAALSITGAIAITAAPSGGAHAWRTGHIPLPAHVAPTALACPAVTLCVAADQAGHIFSTHTPTGAARAWTRIDIGGAVTGLQCPAVTLCVATRTDGSLLTSTDPAGGTWTEARLPGLGVQSISCPTSGLCVATDIEHHVFTTTDPAGGASAWSQTTAPGIGGWVSCASATYCVITAEQDAPGVAVSDNPPGGATTYGTFTAVPDTSCPAPCLSQAIYVLDSGGPRLVDASAPGSGDAIGPPQMFGNERTVTWTHDGAPWTVQLR